MRAGQLRQSLILQQRVIGADAEGTPQENWSNVGVVRADVNPLTPRERLQAGQMEMETTHLVNVRYRADLDQPVSSSGVTSGHNMRFLWGVRVLDVTGVIDPDGHHHVLSLACLERQN